MPTKIDITGLPLIFWVVIVKKNDSYKHHIWGGTSRSVILKRLADHDVLLYMRPFSDMYAAIGHKLFLESLSPESIERVIRQDDFAVTVPDENEINIEE